MTANSERLKSVGGEGGEGGSIDSQLREVEIFRWGGRGGGSIDSQLRENPQSTQRGSVESVDPGVDQQPTQRGSAANSERIHTVC